MYNGIGLSTPRGSGTNGYVQRNLSAVRKQAPRPAFLQPPAAPTQKKPNEGLLDHERKRAIEVLVLQWAEDNDLYGQGLPEEEIEDRLAEKRRELRDFKLDEEKLSRSNETHQYAYAQQKRNDAFMSAVGIKPTYESGSAFDRKAQQQKKEERAQEQINKEKQTLESLDDEQLAELYKHKKSQNREHRYLYRSEVSPPRKRQDDERREARDKEGERSGGKGVKKESGREKESEKEKTVSDGSRSGDSKRRRSEEREESPKKEKGSKKESQSSRERDSDSESSRSDSDSDSGDRRQEGSKERREKRRRRSSSSERSSD